MASISLPVSAAAVIVLTLASCTTTHANRSPGQDLPNGQDNSVRPFNEPVAATTPKSDPTSIAPGAAQELAQNPVGDSSSKTAVATHSPAIANSSGEQQDPRMALAQHLTSIGAKIYTTNWCATCKRQQRDFGEAAFARLTVINCDQQPNICADAGVHRFPTWEINGQKYERGFPLSQLAQLSNYSGPT